MCPISSQDTFLQHSVTILYFFADGSVGDENSAPRNKIGLRHKVLYCSLLSNEFYLTLLESVRRCCWEYSVLPLLPL